MATAQGDESSYVNLTLNQIALRILDLIYSTVNGGLLMQFKRQNFPSVTGVGSLPRVTLVGSASLGFTTDHAWVALCVQLYFALAQMS